MNRLAGGEPPNMPIYEDWFDCFKHLRSGVSIFDLIEHTHTIL